MPPYHAKLLLVSVSAGSGHVRAAEAIKKTAARLYPNIVAEHIDMMDYVSRPMRATILDAYELLASQLPELWRFVYKKTNAPERSRAIRQLAKIINLTNAGKFFRFVASYRPDHVLATHFLPAYALAQTWPTSIVMTDYDKHGLLMTPGMAHYYVSTKKMRWKMRLFGIAEEKIVVSGIPVDPIFYEDKSVSELKEIYRVPAGARVFLALSGGQGLAKLDKIILIMMAFPLPCVVFAIAGSSDSLLAKLKKIKAPAHIDLRVIGWTDAIDEYMRLSDVIITKPGGLTTTECATLQKPIIASSPIPGQEEHNAEYILEKGYGVVARASEDLLYYLEQSPESLAPGYGYKKPPALRPAEIILNTLLNNTSPSQKS